MTTNGFLINKEMSKALRDSGLSSICFSVDSLKKETHNFLRGVDGAYDKLMSAIEYFSPYQSPNIFIATIITKQNLFDLFELAEWVNKNDRICFIHFQALMQPFGVIENDYWHEEEEGKFIWPELGKVHDILDKLIQLKSIGYKISNPLGQLQAFKAYFEDPRTFIKKMTKCNLGKDVVSIAPDGNIFLCFQKDPIGNIKYDRIDEVWFSKKALYVREQIANCRNNCKLMINCFFEKEN